MGPLCGQCLPCRYMLVVAQNFQAICSVRGLPCCLPCRPIVILAERDKHEMDTELESVLQNACIKVITRSGEALAALIDDRSILQNETQDSPASLCNATWELSVTLYVATPACILSKGSQHYQVMLRFVLLMS